MYVFTYISHAHADARLRYRLSVCPSVTRWYCIKMAEVLNIL